MITVIAVIIASAFVLCSCKSKPDTPTTTAAPVEMTSMPELGQGEKTFIFQVHDAEGHITPFKINTDKTIVGEALQELGIIEGEEGDYGLYVKTVNGIFAEYETTGNYWAFYVGDAYASAGIDMTEIVSGETYSLRIEE
ncbi:MAG: DUF4430 domain-containing protein [Ruminococcaceae bacterium]|nr:DUF4430 domain-containing protein [Oscillospiraceae bacterium]